MSIVTEYAVKRSNVLKTGLQCIVAGVLEWALVDIFGWYPRYIANTVAIVLVTLGVMLCIITVIARLIRAKRAEHNVYNAKQFLLAFAQQYRDTRDADIAEVVNAILVLRKAGVLNVVPGDKKLTGTVLVENSTSVSEETQSISTPTTEPKIHKHTITNAVNATPTKASETNTTDVANNTNKQVPIARRRVTHKRVE